MTAVAASAASCQCDPAYRWPNSGAERHFDCGPSQTAASCSTRYGGVATHGDTGKGCLAVWALHNSVAASPIPVHPRQHPSIEADAAAEALPGQGALMQISEFVALPR